MTLAARLADLDWPALETSLAEFGYAKTPPLLTPDECESLIALYGDERRFRNHIDMARYRFGIGDYKYFAEPLPPLVRELRERAYPPLAAIANRWEAALGPRQRYPETLAKLLRLCALRGQTKPKPLLLHYEAVCYKCLHQDIYGEIA
ncbi:MAG: 2OG-Fe(II) oxygenase, partial [Candidatus Rokubacteria bacterium]|nr:2OG-Fe(II) oxygenase [Candidatus Rokubacteria bacterium]